MSATRTNSRQSRDPWSDALAHLGAVDDVWHQRIQLVGPCLLRPRRDRFGSLVRSIVAQQISTKAAQSISQRLLDLLDGNYDPQRLLALSADDLRSVGLSGQKARYLQSLSQAVASGQVPLHQAGRWSDDAIIERLTAIPGIGRWTAEMFLVFALNRPDVLSVGDLGIRAGIQRHFGLAEPPRPDLCRELAAPWRPFRSVAMWYLWREKDIAGAKIP
jgi:DNA-3-methyladenine glycosylase II